MKTKKVVIIDADDWVAVVYNGRVLKQGHSLAPFHWANILNELGIPVEKINIDLDEDGEKVQEAIDNAQLEGQ